MKVIYGKMEILSSSPRVQICPQGCSTSMTKKKWTAYEFKKDGKTNVKEFYAYSAKECDYDGFGKILG
ncbi:hypothetical protein PRIPAC_97841 [Pristionchus pacificus]|uniref:Uncharacterized protein n=1 Tax=Pristionchus pacificus TaxID=54126 RepID=A0A454XRB3_PRIPA|nr:hypothetical protein PRIPAC_97841 [Pristionchus pacificus]|eukprot:PDM66095.1 hypothetical protein PRIPAC_45320 [Pristionchus pacificus]